MSRTRVLLVGAAGETGGSIANGLLENPTFVRISLVLFYLLEFSVFFFFVISLLSYSFSSSSNSLDLSSNQSAPAGTVRPRASPIRSETGHPLPAGSWCPDP